MIYTGCNADILALTDDEIADLEANFPPNAVVTQDQVNIWFEMAFFMRHIFDSIDTAPFS